MEMIKEEEKIEQGDSGLREQIEENDDKMGNMIDPDYKL